MLFGLGWWLYICHISYIAGGGFFEVLTAETKKNVKKGRSSEEKYGKYKWMRMLIDRNTKELKEIRRVVSARASVTWNTP
jgi:hypothetical protein